MLAYTLAFKPCSEVTFVMLSGFGFLVVGNFRIAVTVSTFLIFIHSIMEEI